MYVPAEIIMKICDDVWVTEMNVITSLLLQSNSNVCTMQLFFVECSSMEDARKLSTFDAPLRSIELESKRYISYRYRQILYLLALFCLTNARWICNNKKTDTLRWTKCNFYNVMHKLTRAPLVETNHCVTFTVIVQFIIDNKFL